MPRSTCLSGTVVSLLSTAGAAVTLALSPALQAQDIIEREVTEDELIERKIEEILEAREAEGITVGGAVRFQYTYEDFETVPANQNTERGGDLDFDTFRINFDGTVKDIILSAELRYYQYMQVIHHAWVGYDFTETWQGQAGITRVPFGVLPYNSHNFFFSSNYYLGLEDDYDAGLNANYQSGPWDLQLAFYFNDELGGADGFVDNRSDRYSYDVVGERPASEGTFADPASEVGENNTLNGRLAYTFGAGTTNNTEIGVSAMYGDMNDGDKDVGTQEAYAVHLEGNYGRWNVMLQATQYEYDMDSGVEKMAVGAYSFFDTIPADATTYTANVAYTLPVNAGPISSLIFYNDYSIVTDKSGTDPTTGEDLDDTIMNVTGMALAAGSLYTYFDFIIGENQPFIGGSMGTNDGDTNQRFNINVGYYF